MVAVVAGAKATVDQSDTLESREPMWTFNGDASALHPLRVVVTISQLCDLRLPVTLRYLWLPDVKDRAG